MAAMRAAVVSSSNPREPIRTPALISTLIDRINDRSTSSGSWRAVP
jgi:hypothetical protein